MADVVLWTGATSNNFNVASNWTPAKVPVTTDSLVFAHTSNSCTAGMSTSALFTFPRVEVHPTFTGDLGSSGDPLQFATCTDLYYQGTGTNFYFGASGNSTTRAHIDSTGGSETSCVLHGTISRLTINRGKVTITSGATLNSAIHVGQAGAAANDSTKLTITTATTTSAVLNVHSGIVNTSSSFADVNIDGGELTLAGASAITAKLAIFGGVVWWDSTGTITLLEAKGGRFDASRKGLGFDDAGILATVQRILSDSYFYGDAIGNFDNAGVSFTWTNPIKVENRNRIIFTPGTKLAPS